MATRHGWSDLPEQIRDAIESRIGPVRCAVDIRAGQNNDLTVRLNRTDQPPVFCKGVKGGGRRAMFLDNEAASATRATGIAPAVLCHVELDDWSVVGFEYIVGRPASLAPGSPDLDLVGATVEKISLLPARDARQLRLRWRNTGWWGDVADKAPETIDGWDVDEMSRWSALAPDLVDGDRLLHTDLHADQFLVSDNGHVHVIDWALPGAGAAWVDTAFLVLRLIDAGHTPAAAEQWAHSRSSWSELDGHSLTAFAVYVAGLWSYLAVNNPLPGATRRARLARDYAAWRLAAPSR